MKISLYLCFFFSPFFLFSQVLNDDCDDLIDLGLAPFCPDTVYYNNIGATESDIGEDNIPDCFNGGYIGEDIWFSFISNDTILDYTITLTGLVDDMNNPSIINPQIAVYRGDCSVDNLALFDCISANVNQSSLSFNIFDLDPGVPYFLRINSYSQTATSNAGSFQLCVEEIMGVIASASSETICLGETVTLTATGGVTDDYLWEPQNQFLDPTLPIQTVNPNTTTTYTVTATSNTGPSAILNGDFELGDTLFTSEYIMPEMEGMYGLLSNEGTYAVTMNSNLVHNNFADCTDNTSGIGNMMVVNGAVTANQELWCQTVNIIPFTNYMFSTWATSVETGNPAILQFSINDELLGNPFNVSFALCQWDQFFEIWNSGNSTEATICIVNQNTFSGGNDFALDDISLIPIALSSDSVTVAVSDISASVQIDGLISCDLTCIDATANGNNGIPPYSYTWPANANNQTTQTAFCLTADIYEVTITDAQFCTATAQFEISQPDLISLSGIANSPCSDTETGSIDLVVESGNTNSIVLTPIADTYISDLNPTTNYGGEEELIVDPSWNGDPEIRTLLKFDLSNIDIPANANIVSVSLKMQAFAGYAFGGDGNVYTRLVTDDTWDENSVTWDNQPDAPDAALGSWWIWNDNSPIDVTGIFSSQELADTVFGEMTGDEIISFKLNSPGYLTNYRSREFNDPEDHPMLIIEYECLDYAWTGPESFTSEEQDIDNLIPGVYDVIVTDCLGCLATYSAEIFPPTLLEVSASENTICAGESVNLSVQTTIPGNIMWSPAASLDDPTSNNPIANPTNTTTYTVTYNANNLIENGDFESGNTGFTTDYNYIAPPLGGGVGGQGNYTISPSSPTQWSQCVDHTSGSGNMMITDASTTADQNLWCQTVSLIENTNYTFSFWAQTMNAGSGGLANLSVTIDGIPIVDSYGLGSVNCEWEEISTPYVSNITTNIQICILDLSINGGGNDFAIDDISLTTVCTYSDEITITVSNMETTLLTIDETCLENDGSAEVNVTSGIEPYSYDWSNGDDTNSSNDLSAGNHSLTVSDLAGCEEILNFDIASPNYPSLQITTSIDPSCDDNDGSILVEGSGGNPPYQYSIDAIDFTNDPNFTALSAETYTITMLDDLGCTTTESNTLSLPENPEATITTNGNSILCDDNTVLLEAGDFTTYLWSDDSTDSSLEITETGTYTVTVTDENNCSDIAEIQITSCNGWEIANAFTPNGDGINDTFGPTYFGGVEIISFKIYNRWGQLIFEDPNSLWDGTFNGITQASDVYVYILEINNPEKEMEKVSGDVTLIR